MIRFGHLVDLYAWNPHCRHLDGLGPSGNYRIEIFVSFFSNPAIDCWHIHPLVTPISKLISVHLSMHAITFSRMVYP